MQLKRRSHNQFWCCNSAYRLRYWNVLYFRSWDRNCRKVATVLTVYGIETVFVNKVSLSDFSWVATVLTVYGIETIRCRYWLGCRPCRLQQCLPFTVCAEGCETAEEQSDDEVHTSQVPEQSEGKTKVMKQQYLPFTVLKQESCLWQRFSDFNWVATVPTVYGMRRRV